jgi:predicted transposase YdaD
MSKPYDATSKDLIEADPAGWVAFLSGSEPSAVSLVDADLSTITTDADKVILVGGPSPWLLHLDFQSSWEEAMDRRLLRYNALLHYRHGLPVASHVVILRQSANMTGLNGRLTISPQHGPEWAFAYGVLRVWERSAADFLNGPIGLLPLAPLADLRGQELPAIIQSLRDRIHSRADRPLSAKLWAASYVLMGLRYDEAVIDSVLSGVMQMEESVTYQAILRRGLQDGLQQGLQQGLEKGIRNGIREGTIQEARRFFLAMAEQKLGRPGSSVLAKVSRIDDVVHLEALGKRLFSVATWDELLSDT